MNQCYHREIRSGFRLLVEFALALSLPAAALAGDTGRIMGKTTDASTGEALAGVNVVVVGTSRGASTDADGRYSIIGIPAGTYTIRATLLSYRPLEVRNVEIEPDRTYPLNIRMVASSLEMGEIVVTGQGLVNTQSTSTEQTITSHTIEQIPNVKTVQDVLALQPGVVKLGKNLFLRGGRANEIQYIVDGVAVNDILGGSSGLLATTSANDQLQQLYSGVQSGYIGGGATGLAVSANAIQAVTVSSSGIDAEYGNAQSGVINIMTKSGSDRYVGSVQYRTDNLTSNSFNESYVSFNVGGPEPITNYLLPMAGVTIPGTLTFFLNTDFDQNDGPWNFAKNQYFNPLQRKIELSGFMGGLFNGLGFNYQDKLNNNYTFDTKLKYDVSGSEQFMYSYHTSLGSFHGFNQPWMFLADSSQVGTNISSLDLLQWTHYMGSNSFFRLSLSRTQNRSRNDVAGLPPSEYSAATSGNDPNHDYFNEFGTDQGWYDALDNVWTVKFDINDKVHPIHLLKAGLEFDYEAVQSTEIQYPLAGNRTIDPNAQGEYPGYGLYRWVLNNYSNRGAMYAEDIIEYEGLNILAGLRYDYLYPGRQIFDPNYVSQWERATSLNAQWPEHKVGNSAMLWYLTHGWVSPRLAVGYPITERMVFYFNYAHFYQFPTRDQYFRDPFTLKPGDWIGNPDLKPAKTIQYEAGFDDQFSDDMAIRIAGFYKDIFDYTALAPAGPPGLQTNLFVNLDYGSARGIEISLNRTLAQHFSGNIDYTYQVAKGRSASPYASIYQPQFQLPRETRLPWDQEHTISMFLSYRVSPMEEFDVFGIPLNNWGISLTWSYGSGFPYTPYNSGRSLASALLVNSVTGPYSSMVNMTIYKGFLMFEHLNTMITLDITNLLNRRNPTTDGSVFNSYTGQTDKFGDYDPNTGIVYPWYTIDGNFLRPYRFGNPRQVLLGVKLNWD